MLSRMAGVSKSELLTSIEERVGVDSPDFPAIEFLVGEIYRTSLAEFVLRRDIWNECLDSPVVFGFGVQP